MISCPILKRCHLLLLCQEGLAEGPGDGLVLRKLRFLCKIEVIVAATRLVPIVFLATESDSTPGTGTLRIAVIFTRLAFV